MNFNLNRIGMGGALLLIVAVGLALQIFNGLFGAVEGQEFSLDKLLLIAILATTALAIYGTWKLRGGASKGPKAVAYIAWTLAVVLTVMLSVLGTDTTKEVLLKGRTTAQETVSETILSSPEGSGGLIGSGTIDQRSKRVANTPWAKWVEGNIGLPWWSVLIAAIVFIVSLYRRNATIATIVVLGSLLLMVTLSDPVTDSDNKGPMVDTTPPAYTPPQVQYPQVSACTGQFAGESKCKRVTLRWNATFPYQSDEGYRPNWNPQEVLNVHDHGMGSIDVKSKHGNLVTVSVFQTPL